MRLLTSITKGKAVFVGNDLRCYAPRTSGQRKVCNKLLAKKNAIGQLAGNFRCERCCQEVEVTLVEVNETRK
jgi:hypothetical protein